MPDGDYIVLGYESERLNDGFQAVTTTIVPPESAESGTADPGAYGAGTYNQGTYNQ